MFQAVLLDFYGTVVHEDDIVIDRICQTIADASPGQPNPGEVGSYWWDVFSSAFRGSHGDTFATQRALEHASLDAICEHFGAACNAHELSELMFAHWQTAPLFEEARAFLAANDLPVVVLSNIDRADIEAVIDAHGLAFDIVITSEDVRSYKPRPELFEAGLAALGAQANDVLHVGDSVSSDVTGANALGIPVAWVNRQSKVVPAGARPDFEIATLSELGPILSSD